MWNVLLSVAFLAPYPCPDNYCPCNSSKPCNCSPANRCVSYKNASCNCNVALAGPEQLAKPPTRDASYEWRWYDDGDASQVALMDGGKQVGAYRFKDGAYREYDAKANKWGKFTKPPIEPPAMRKADEATDALDEVNAARARRGLHPFRRDDGLTVAAKRLAAYRAKRLIEGHTQNDFQFVPDGSRATATGCAAWPPELGWGSCCWEEEWTSAGAAWAKGSDGRRYMHLVVR